MKSDWAHQALLNLAKSFRASRTSPTAVNDKTTNWRNTMKTTNKNAKALLLGMLPLLSIFCQVGQVSSQTCVQPPTGLVAWWPGDGNALDIIGPNNGTLVDGATFNPGLVGQAFSLDGIDDIVDLGGNNIIGSGNAPFTIVAWMFPTRIPTGLYYFLIRLKQDAQFFVGFTQDAFGVPGGLVGAIFRGEAHQWLTPIDHSSLVNQWTHVAVIYNGGNKADASSFAIFFNGVQLPTGSVDLGPVGGNCNDNALGSDAGISCVGDFGGGNTRFRGLIDEVQIYNRVLSASEIQAIFNAGSAGACKPGAVISVNIDIKPGSVPNSINPKSNGVIPVAILTTDDFDATTVDPLSVEFGPNGATEFHGRGHIEDADGDGDQDIVLHFKTQQTGILCGDTEANLTGKTTSGQDISGMDEIQTVGCASKAAAESATSLPQGYVLFRNHPNPFNPETEIRFQLPKASHVAMKIFNSTGQEIRILADAQYEAGYRSVHWNGEDKYGKAVSSGVYLCQLQAGNFSQVIKMNLLR
jgi:hypothetical protein